MSRLTHHEYNPLMQSYKTAMRCGKCGLCRYIDNNEIRNSRFSFICPSGAKFKFEEYWGSGKSEILRGLITQLGAVTTEINFNERLIHALYTCTTCAGCQTICETIGKEPLKTIFSLREKAVLEGEILPVHKEILDNIITYGNPWGNPPELRTQWFKHIKSVKDISKEKAKILFFVGCAPYKQEMIASTVSAVEILTKTGADFGILGSREKCCGIALMRIGDKRNFEKIAMQNLSIFNELGIEKIITACACCFQVLRDEYEEIANFSLNFEVQHITEYLAELIDTEELKLKKISSDIVTSKNPCITYHDPCNLGRYTNVYKPPRTVLTGIPGIEFVEMYRNRQNAWCCGAGGSGETAAAYPEYAKWVAEERIEEAKSVGANTIVTACPFCEDMLASAADDGVQVMDIARLVEKLI